jgi:hypothetical protein
MEISKCLSDECNCQAEQSSGIGATSQQCVSYWHMFNVLAYSRLALVVIFSANNEAGLLIGIDLLLDGKWSGRLYMIKLAAFAL